jgi:hypothetical protein
MGKRDWSVLAIAAVCLLLVVLGYMFPAMADSALSTFLPAREGRVLVEPGNQPIAGATVKARCEVIDPTKIFSIHGSGTRFLPDIVTTSDEHGRFSFDARTLSECRVVFVSAEKPGYQTTSEVVWRSLLDNNAGHAPTRSGSDVWMMPRDVIHDRYLRTLVLKAELSPGASVEHQFDSVFSALSCAMRTAQTPEQRTFARDNLCQRARALVERLAPTERSATGSNRMMTSHCSPVGGGYLESERITTEAVETYCRTP